MAVQSVITEILAAAVTMATPFLLAALGEVIGQRSGVLNLGIDGMMLMGAIMGVVGALTFNNLWAGVLIAAIIGGILGLIMGFLVVYLRTQQHVTGLMIGFLCVGAATFINKMIVGAAVEIPRVETFKSISVPILNRIPVLGPILFNQDPMVYLAFLLILVVYIILFKTTLGLKIRAIGENPRAVDTVGVNVLKIRCLSVIIAGVFAGLGGAYLSLARVGLFTEGITGGRGWIAIAIVCFSRWNPLGVLAGSILFGAADAIQYRLQIIGGIGIPAEVWLMLPYLLTILVLVFVYKGTGMPSKLTIPYKRGS